MADLIEIEHILIIFFQQELVYRFTQKLSNDLRKVLAYQFKFKQLKS